MILRWADPEWMPIEQVVGVLFDGRVVRRKDIQLLLNCSPRSLTHKIERALHYHEPLIRSIPVGRRLAYTLTQRGMVFAHAMAQAEGRPVAVTGHIEHSLAVNAILVRYILRYGRALHWYSTREASDEIWYLRDMHNGESDAAIRATAIRPDAMMVTSEGLRTWIEYDNGTETARQLRRKYRLYVVNLRRFEPTDRRVFWVAGTLARAQYMQRLWFDVGSANGLDMRFFAAGQESQYLNAK